MRRRETAEPKAVDGAKETIVTDAESVVVDICALQTLELACVVIISSIEGVSVVLKGRECQGEGIAAAPERLFFSIEGEGFGFQGGEFGIQACFFLFNGDEVSEGAGFGGTGGRERALGGGNGGWAGKVVG